MDTWPQLYWLKDFKKINKDTKNDDKYTKSSEERMV
ncbi:hypothetical protein Syn7803C26_185 [Synechococcus phage ACG-2014a]|uniref:Uncharacterized protein n=1 Tax=Synechococcus phage ACG-2014a TaxID=1493507 RepID=A0A0E3I8D6_9CAUD|nr:hypothetical protein Syn7803C26_185 [Synechococcus phage ACG-2014a]